MYFWFSFPLGLVYHVPQALEKFSFLPDIGCSQVERKNYDQRCAYFNATSRDGGKERTSVTRQVTMLYCIPIYGL